jgi:hypothetical protein
MNIVVSPDNSNSAMHRSYFSDHSLASRLERAEATANACFVEARAQLEPGVGAQWIKVAGAYAMFDGVRSPCTQTFGLGLFKMPTKEDVGRIEAFFAERHAPVFHEVSPLADSGLIPLLDERDYQPVEFSTVMFLPMDEMSRAVSTRVDNVEVRIITDEERDLWARTAAEGWHVDTEFADLLFSMMRINAFRSGGTCFLAELRGQPVATGALAIHDGVALSGRCQYRSEVALSRRTKGTVGGAAQVRGPGRM